jgi:hypothetical protein
MRLLCLLPFANLFRGLRSIRKIAQVWGKWCNDSIAGTNTSFPLRLAFTRRRQVPGCYFWQSLLRSILNKLSATSGIAYIHLSISHHFAIYSDKVVTELVVDVWYANLFWVSTGKLPQSHMESNIPFRPAQPSSVLILRTVQMPACSYFVGVPSSASAGSGSPGVITRRRYSCAGT